MEDKWLYLEYLNWLIMIALILGLFSRFVGKEKMLGSLVFLVFAPTWGIMAILKGLEYYFLYDNPILFSIDGFLGMAAETLPMLVLIGGITFTLKYLRYKKKKMNLK